MSTATTNRSGCKIHLDRDYCDCKATEYKPNYAVSPMETLSECCLHGTFGSEMVADFEKGITEKNVYLIVAMFPSTSRGFWLKLQKNYNETVERLGVK